MGSNWWVCPTCGAVVAQSTQHILWHEAQEQQED